MTRKTIFIIVGIVTALFLFGVVKSCLEPKNTTTIKVVTPKVEGSFDKPIQYIPIKSKKDSLIYLPGKVIYTENSIDKELAKEYLIAKDSIEKLKLYLEAIGEQEGTSVFDNQDLKLEVYTKTRGKLLEIKPKYTIKEKEIKLQVRQKIPVFTLYAGGEVISSGITSLAVKADIGIQNKKGSMLTLGVDNNQNYYLGAKFKIFSIKK